MFREIEDIVDAHKYAKSRNKTCTVLIGAGCSVSAGIPTDWNDKSDVPDLPHGAM